ncbi:hypothetical protein KQX54_008878, partial [Cotesia glomerata]
AMNSHSDFDSDAVIDAVIDAVFFLDLVSCIAKLSIEKVMIAAQKSLNFKDEKCALKPALIRITSPSTVYLI